MPNTPWAFAAAGLLLWGAAGDLPAASGNVAGAGGPYRIKVWETEDGLPRNSVLAITQTRDGYLWLGTPNGLVRFDGIRFTVFEENNTPGLKSSRILSLFEDSRSNLWIGTETAGVALMKDGVVTTPDIRPGASLIPFVAACEDSSGTVWMFTNDGQWRRYRDGTLEAWRAAWELPANHRAILAQKSGALWVDTVDRVWMKSAVRKHFLFASERGGGYWRLADGHVHRGANGFERDLGPYPWSGAMVSAVCEDRQGNLVVGTLGAGVFWFDAEGKAESLSTEQGLSYNYVLSLHFDREGSLWVGTDGGGLNRVKRHLFGVLEETRGLVVQSVCEDAQSGLWIGFNVIGLNANEVSHWQDGRMRWFGPGQGPLNPPVRAVFMDRNQGIWAGTWGWGLFQFQQEGENFQRVVGSEAISRIHAIHQDRRGRLWVGGQEGLARRDESGWKVFTTANGLSANEVQAIAEDADVNLWVGTVGGGLHRLRDDAITSFRDQLGTSGKDISSLYVDSAGVLWIGTDGNGLARLQDGHWTRYTTREGLISNGICYLIEDEQGYMWIGSIAGLMRVKKQALDDFARGSTTFIPFRAFGIADGLPTSECPQGSQPGACRARDGKLWLPTIKGLVSVAPAQLHPNTNPPPVMIESVLIDNQAQNTNQLRVTWPHPLVVPAHRESLEIHYTSLNLAAPERARFKYRLEGHETGWKEAGSDERVARYIKLPAGRYNFHVTACNEDGLWNEAGAVLAIIVQPPFWRTWWFLTASALCLLGAVAGVVHYFSTQQLQRQLAHMRQQEALEKERARIARDIHDQVGANLTQVSLLGELVESDKDSPDDVAAHAKQISQAARETTRALDEIVWTVNPSNDTLEGLVNYICKNAQDYFAVAGLRYRLDVPPQLPATPIPPDLRHNVFLAARESVTNIVRHAQATAAWVRLRLEPGRFILEIEDNGRGLGDVSSKSHRNGLRNMRNRLAEVGGECTIGPGPEGGTLVRLTAPLPQP